MKSIVYINASVDCRCHIKLIDQLNIEANLISVGGEALFELSKSYSDSLFVVAIVPLNMKQTLALLDRFREDSRFQMSWLVILVEESIDRLSLYDRYACYACLPLEPKFENIRDVLKKLLAYEVKPITNTKQYVFQVSVDGLFKNIPFYDIIYIEVYYKVTTIYTKSRSYDLKRYALNQLIEELPNCFLRCHRSYIVNTHFIESLQNDAGYYFLKLASLSEEIPIGRKYRKCVAEHLK